MFKLKYHKQIKKDIKKFSSNLKDIILNKHLIEIKENPYKYKILKGKFKEFKKYIFTYNGVSYRIIYKIVEKEGVIYVYIIHKREGIYEKLIQRKIINIFGRDIIN